MDWFRPASQKSLIVILSFTKASVEPNVQPGFFRFSRVANSTKVCTISSWDKLPACRFENDRLEAYPTSKFGHLPKHSIAR